MDTLKELLDQMYHISGVKETDKAAGYILSIVAAKDAEIAKLRAALEAVEWNHMYGIICPWCERGVAEGHAPDCQRQAALGLKR